jgi:hypothetical protein
MVLAESNGVLLLMVVPIRFLTPAITIIYRCYKLVIVNEFAGGISGLFLQR